MGRFRNGEVSFGREPTSLLTVQPIVFYNLPQGFYLRSSAIWNFDFENNLGYIPVGLGAGKVMQIGKVTMNAFIEPQYTVYKYGEQVPHWQIFRRPEFSILRRKQDVQRVGRTDPCDRFSQS